MYWRSSHVNHLELPHYFLLLCIISLWMHVIIPLLMNLKVVFNSLVANDASMSILEYASLGVFGIFLE